MAQVATNNRRKQSSEKVKLSFFASLFFHTAFLLILSCIILRAETKPAPILNLNFSEEISVFEDLEVLPLEIEALEINQEIHNEESETIQVQLDSSDFSFDTPEIFQETIPGLVIKEEPVETAKIKTVPAQSIRQGDSGFGNGPEEMKSRLQVTGAKTGDIQISISWDNSNDIDLWVHCSGSNFEEYIGWNNKMGFSGGWLDVDANIYPYSLTKTPVENIFWATNSAPRARYFVYVHFYQKWDTTDTTQVLIRVLQNGRETYRRVNLRFGEEPRQVLSFQH